MLENMTAFDGLILFCSGGAIIGYIAYNKLKAKEVAESVKHEIKSEMLDKEQTKEIQRINREIDDIKRTK